MIPPTPPKTDRQARLRALILGDPWRLQVLTAARGLALPDWAIGAGFVRSAVWDHLQGFTERSALDDIDLLYFDPGDLSEDREKAYDRRLGEAAPGIPWSVKNQARMHLRNDDAPYRGTEDALRHWLETPTAVAVRLETDGRLTVMAPHGLDDLWAMRTRPTPSGRRRHAEYAARMKAKDWPGRWPRVRVMGV